jgi:hypothetical protein
VLQTELRPVLQTELRPVLQTELRPVLQTELRPVLRGVGACWSTSLEGVEDLVGALTEQRGGQRPAEVGDRMRR